MKKFKLMITSLFLALALIFGSASSLRVYADTDEPQGGSKSTNAPASPAPSMADVLRIISMMLALI
jgi:hypothetical protein